MVEFGGVVIMHLVIPRLDFQAILFDKSVKSRKKQSYK